MNSPFPLVFYFFHVSVFFSLAFGSLESKRCLNFFYFFFRRRHITFLQVPFPFFFLILVIGKVRLPFVCFYFGTCVFVCVCVGGCCPCLNNKWLPELFRLMGVLTKMVFSVDKRSRIVFSENIHSETT